MADQYDRDTEAKPTYIQPFLGYSPKLNDFK